MDFETVALDDDIRRLMSAANYVHLSTLRKDGTPRNWVVWVDVEDDYILVCTGRDALKGRDMLRNPAVGLSVFSNDDPYDMAAIQGRVVDVRDDNDGRYMNPISHKYTGEDFPPLGGDRACFVIAAVMGAGRKLPFRHNPES